jgi:hypothetical protein
MWERAVPVTSSTFKLKDETISEAEYLRKLLQVPQQQADTSVIVYRNRGLLGN